MSGIRLGSVGLILLLITILTNYNVALADQMPDFMKIKNVPYEKLYFTLDSDKFHPGLKYPPFRQCEIPIKLNQRKCNNNTLSNDTNIKTDGDGRYGCNNKTKEKHGRKKWRIFWSSSGWGKFYLDFDGISGWEREMENFTKSAVEVELGFPVVLVIAWIAVVLLVDLLLYPFASMIVFRGMLLFWVVISNWRIRKIFRAIIITKEKFHRNHVLKVYQDAGRRPPFYRYSLPWFFRIDEKDVVPKELNETDEEFWSSDDEGQNQTKNGKVDKETGMAIPDLCPEYEAHVHEEVEVSDEMHLYMRKVSKHGMFAVWTNEMRDINLDQISEVSQTSKKKISSSSTQSLPHKSKKSHHGESKHSSVLNQKKKKP